MKYQGGKSRTTARICPVLESLRPAGAPFVDAFCGAINIVAGMSGQRVAIDLNKYLISTYRAMQAGWVPPSFVSKEQYNKLKERMDASNPLTGFALVACTMFGSFACSYFVRTDEKDPLASTVASLQRKIAACEGVEFFALDFVKDFECDGALVYCDPPYEGTSTYRVNSDDAFDHKAFWQKCRDLSQSNIVVVSEISCPDDWVEISSFAQAAGFFGHSKVTAEKLYMTRHQASTAMRTVKEPSNGRR